MRTFERHDSLSQPTLLRISRIVSGQPPGPLRIRLICHGAFNDAKPVRGFSQKWLSIGRFISRRPTPGYDLRVCGG